MPQKRLEAYSFSDSSLPFGHSLATSAGSTTCLARRTQTTRGGSKEGEQLSDKKAAGGASVWSLEHAFLRKWLGSSAALPKEFRDPA